MLQFFSIWDTWVDVMSLIFAYLSYFSWQAYSLRMEQIYTQSGVPTKDRVYDSDGNRVNRVFQDDETPPININIDIVLTMV